MLIAWITRNESSSPFMGGDVAPKGALEFKRVRGAIKISSLRDFDDLRLSFAGAYSLTLTLSQRERESPSSHWQSFASLYPAFSALSLSLKLTRLASGTFSRSEQSDG